MRIHFEEWVNNILISKDARILFEEALICYRSKAYRAAFLFTYIGFLTIIKNRIIVSRHPNGYQEQEWNIIKRNILNDETWDHQVFEQVMKKDKNKKVFDLSDNIRTQVLYWKDRRNDCAHAKNNIINCSHVESFWNFIESNLSKFAVLGSDEEIINKTRTHFDESKTPIGAPYDYLIEEIPKAINLDKFDNFLYELYKVLVEIYEENWFYYELPSNFFSQLLSLDNENYNEVIVSFIINNEKLAEDIATHNPESLIYFSHEKKFIRNIWYSKVEGMYNKSEFVTILLRKNLIPKDEIEEFIKHVVHKNKDSIPYEEDVTDLKSYGYFDVVEHIFNQGLTGGFDWWFKENEKFAKYYLTKFKLNEDFYKAYISTNQNKISNNMKKVVLDYLKDNKGENVGLDK